MLSYFPQMYPDEILYSVIARYHKYSGNTHMSQTTNDVFGNMNEPATVMLPRNLRCLSNETERFDVSFEDLLFRRTLFPFVTLFRDDNYIQLITSWVEKDIEKATYSKLGLWRKNEPTPTHLRYCPVCLKEETAAYGEGYWHRLHQTPGVSVCTKHYVLLQDSIIPYASYDSKAYKCLDETLLLSQAIPEKLDHDEIALAEEIASGIQWLFDNLETFKEYWEKYNESFQGIYLFLIEKKGLSTSGGSIRVSQFKKEFIQYFGNYLSLWDLEFSTTKHSCWPMNMLRTNARRYNPLRHVLMMQFLAGSVSQFFDELFCFEEVPQIGNKIMWKQASDNNPRKIDYREVWKTFCENNPNERQNDIRMKIPAVYTWLIRHDNEWLRKNSPVLSSRTRRSAIRASTDWDMKDATLFAQLKILAEAEIRSQQRPIRITKTRLGQSTRSLNTIYRRCELIPKSKRYLDRVVETRDEYRKRKLMWTATEITNRDEPIIMWKLMKSAGIPDRMWPEYWEFFQKCRENNTPDFFGIL